MRPRNTPPVSACALLLCALVQTNATLGIDFGSANSVIATTRRGGVDVLVNEASRRQTPSVVAFDEQQRLLGESAAAQRGSNPQGSVAEIKALIGCALDAAQRVHPPLQANLVEGEHGEALVELRLRGQTERFSATQLLAMLLHQLHRCAQRELGAVPSACTLAVPLHFSAGRRQAVLDAAAIAGLRGVRLISDVRCPPPLRPPCVLFACPHIVVTHPKAIMCTLRQPPQAQGPSLHQPSGACTDFVPGPLL